MKTHETCSRRSGWLLLLVTAAISGCRSQAEEPWCDICSLTAHVVGSVRSTSGAPVPNVLVRLMPVYSSGIDVGATGTDTTRTATDGSGVFDAVVSAISMAYADRIEIRLTPLPEDGLQALVDTLPASFSLPWEEPPTVRATFNLLPLGSGGPT